MPTLAVVYHRRAFISTTHLHCGIGDFFAPALGAFLGNGSACLHVMPLDRLHVRLQLLSEEGREVRRFRLGDRGAGSGIWGFCQIAALAECTKRHKRWHTFVQCSAAFAIQHILLCAHRHRQQISAVGAEYERANGSHCGGSRPKSLTGSGFSVQAMQTHDATTSRKTEPKNIGGRGS